MSVRAVLFAFGLTVLAGLSTGIGSAWRFTLSRLTRSFSPLPLGFSAGVMIYVSMIEIFVKARASLEHAYGPTKGTGSRHSVSLLGLQLSRSLIGLCPVPKTPTKCGT